MERLRLNYGVNPEANYEMQVIFDDVVKRETEHRPNLNSRRKKLIFIQETFGWWDVIEIAHVLGVDEKDAKRYLSRRGIRNNEFDEIERRFNAAFAITSIIEHHVSGLLPRRDAFVKPNPLLGNVGIKQTLIRGNVEKAVFVAERTFRHIHEQS